MKLGAKKTQGSALLDVLNAAGEALLSEDMSVPGTPAVSSTPELALQTAPKNERGSLPPVTPERWCPFTSAFLAWFTS